MSGEKSVEIEVKHLVLDRTVVRLRSREGDMIDEGTAIVQGYFPARSGCTVRVRFYPTQGRYTLTVKGPRIENQRLEEEQGLSTSVGEALINSMADRLISKTRYPVVGPDGNMWTIDVFHDLDQGLVLAELELPSKSSVYELPTWCGAEVTDDERYYNAYLVGHPYTNWGPNAP